MQLSLSTLMGSVAGVVIVGWGVMSATDNPYAFIDLGALYIVVGGTITASFIGFRWRYIVKALLSLPGIFIRQKINPKTLKQDVGMIIDWAKMVQTEGKTAFTKIGESSKDPFVKYLTSLVETGYTEEEIRILAETHLEEDYFRNLQQPTILANMASHAPAFGMIGTLIGLIAMLEKLDDPSQMGPGLSVALMTTLYGVLFARFMFMPASTKVKQILGIKRFRNYLLLEGFSLIMHKHSAFFIQDRLNSFLDPKFQYSIGDVSKGKKA
jgi:chemotaxis protein MotA